MQRWYLGRNKPRSSSIPTALGDSPGLWERIWENSKLTSKSGWLTRGAGAQQRFGTRLCPRQAPHCPSSHQRAFPTSCITKRAQPRARTLSQLPPHATAVHPHPSCQHSFRAAPHSTPSPKTGTLRARGALQAVEWGRSSALPGSAAKAQTLPSEQARTGGGSRAPPALPAAAGNEIPSPADSAAAWLS